MNESEGKSESEDMTESPDRWGFGVDDTTIAMSLDVGWPRRLRESAEFLAALERRKADPVFMAAWNRSEAWQRAWFRHDICEASEAPGQASPDPTGPERSCRRVWALLGIVALLGALLLWPALAWLCG